jgi:hypothetical protein
VGSLQYTSLLVIAIKGSKQEGSVTSGVRGVNVTLIVCINALGNSIPPVLIFPRIHFKIHMLNNAPWSMHGTSHPCGWSHSEKFIEFLDHFIHHVKPTKDKKVLLRMDNHESHVSIAEIIKARENGIIMLTFPPHTSFTAISSSYWTNVFGPFKKYYNTAYSNWMLTNPGKPISFYNVGHFISVAYPSAFYPCNIQSRLRASGLWPINADIFRDDEYLNLCNRQA